MITVFGIIREITEKLFIQNRFYDHHRIAKELTYRMMSNFRKNFNGEKSLILP
jgi:hypothetical protein